VEDVFRELVSFPHLLASTNFSVDVLLIAEEEVRRYVGKKRRWRRKGWEIEERRLLGVLDQRVFEEPADWRALLPEGLAVSFTAKDLAETIGIRLSLAQKMAYCLRNAEIIQLTGKRGRANAYEIA
jgi:hypothetical protein